MKDEMTIYITANITGNDSKYSVFLRLVNPPVLLC